MSSFVDLFFVISGFVITRMLIRVPEGRRVSLENFWIRRFLRIWPVYFLVIGGGTLALLLYKLVAPGFSIPGGVWKCFVFLQFTELYVPGTGGPFDVFEPYPRWLAHSWSLAVEEQFYLVWPLVLGLVSRRSAGLLALCAAMAVACAAANFAHWPPLTLATRGLGLPFGAVLAMVELRLESLPVPRRLRSVAGILSGFLLCAGLAWTAPFVADGYAGGPSWSYMTASALDVIAFAMLYAGLVGCLVLFPRGLLARALSARLLVYAGGLSYAIYMFHFPVMAMFGHTDAGWPLLEGYVGPRAQVAFWIVLFGLSYLSRQWLEMPFNERKGNHPLYVPKP